MSELTGKKVLVTGGARGIGRDIVRHLAASGAELFINYFHSKEDATSTAQELKDSSVTAHLLRGSVAKHEHIERMVGEVLKHTDSIDVLINNAAAGSLKPITEVSETEWQRTWQICVKGTVDVTLCFADLLAANGGGCVVNLSSIGANMVLGNYAAVGISKAAVESATRYLAVELAPRGVRVNCASCTPIDNSVLRLFPDHEGLRYLLDSVTPLGSVACVDDYVELVSYLASRRSRWITGQTIIADGGLSLGAALLTPPSFRSGNALLHAGDDGPTQFRGERAPIPAGNPRREAAAPEPAPTHLGIQNPVAVVGMGIVGPQVDGVDGFWRLLTSGAPVFQAPGGRWSTAAYHSADGVVTPDRCSPPVLGLIADASDEDTPVNGSDYVSTWLRAAILQAWTPHSAPDGAKVGLFIGATPDGSQHLDESILMAAIRRHAKSDGRCDPFVALAESHLTRRLDRPEESLPHISIWDAANGILPETTEVLTIDTACSSSLYAIDVAMRRLGRGHCDVAVCGGAYALNPRSVVLFAQLGGFSSLGEVSAFDRRADGTLFSDGAGVVVLKRLADARADDDSILAIIGGSGLSSDGRGKAIYAPNSRGQIIAMQRAYRSSGIDPHDVGMVVAHGTGTPAGDLAEVTALSKVFEKNADIAIRSNKSLLGHTAWGAGVVSLIHAVLSLQKSTIPGQRPAPTPPAEWKFPSGMNLDSATKPFSPRHAGPRIVGINSFGFGGTNAHTILLENHPDIAEKERAVALTDDPVVVVDWSSVFPGAPDRPDVEKWLSGTNEAPWPPTFDRIPPVPFRMLRVSTQGQKLLDPAQRLALLAVEQMHDTLHPVWQKYAETTGVICAHTGMTRTAIQYVLRTSVADLRIAMENAGQPRGGEQVIAAETFAAFEKAATTAVPPSTEDSYPASMPGLIPARVAAALDLHGLVLTTDEGTGSGIASLTLAYDYVSSGTLDLALVLSVHSNTLPEWTDTVGPAFGDATEVGEGAICIALMRRSNAIAAGLPIVGTVEAKRNDVTSEPHSEHPRTKRSYGAADSMLAVLRALHSSTETSNQQHISWTDPLTGRAAHVTIAKRANVVNGSARSTNMGSYVLAYDPAAPTGRADEKICSIQPKTLVITTERGELPVELPHQHSVVRVEQSSAQLVSLEHIKILDWIPEHVLAVVDLSADDRTIAAAHDAIFLATQQLSETATGDRSIQILLINAVNDGKLPVAASGLFTGISKSLACEFPRASVLTLITSARETIEAFAQLAAELHCKRITPVVLYVDSTRLEPHVRRLPDSPGLRHDHGQSAVKTVVAVGGARGITAEIVKDIVDKSTPNPPEIWLIGRTNLTSASPVIPGRAEFMRSKAGHIRPVEAIALYQKMVSEHEVARTVEALEQRCGAQHVHYLQCDVRDKQAVDRVIESITRQVSTVDLMLFAAGVDLPSDIRKKRLDDFHRVRDTKLLGYRNLMSAFGSNLPRRWINFGSIAAFAGLPGEADYCAANDYLACASAEANTAPRRDHCQLTIAWPVWKETGLASNRVTQLSLNASGAPGISSQEGVRLFWRDLPEVGHLPYIVHLGPVERETVERRFPGYWTAAEHDRELEPSSIAEQKCDRGGLLTKANARVFAANTHSAHDRGSVSFSLDVRTDWYLNDHRVDGKPTMPGTFLVELALEASTALHPHLVPTRVKCGTFDRFLRTHPQTGDVSALIEAVSTRTSCGNTEVTTTITADIRTPNGEIIERDRRYCQCVVVLSHAGLAPRRVRPLAADGVPVPDPYYLPNGAIELAGPFVSTSDTAIAGDVALSRFRWRDEQLKSPLEMFTYPAVLADGLARTAVVLEADDQQMPTFALKSFESIEILEPGSDAQVSRNGGRGILFECRRHAPGGGYDCVALDEAGDVVLEIHGLEGHRKGSVDRVGQRVRN
jgi:3-oxoacyl-(acyl-carrier-protein) synthase/NAD(P)-dependent dehydrogenase (short-subunit alcohol dehydrogenase family)